MAAKSSSLLSPMTTSVVSVTPRRVSSAVGPRRILWMMMKKRFLDTGERLT
jgi:hypothetical protein